MNKKYYEIYVKGGLVKKWSKLATVEGKHGQFIFDDLNEAKKVVDFRLSTNTWLKKENFQIKPLKQDLRMHGRVRKVHF